MRRIVATLLVVASPALMAVPADAGESRASSASPAAVAPAPVAVPAAPITVAPPATPVAAVPATPAPVVATPAVPAPAKAVAAVRPVVRKAPAVAVADVEDAAYTARLMADLCEARPVFCGLDRSGRYPGR